MNLKELGEQQRQALLDLAILAMYADGHLAAVEDSRVQRLLGALGYESEYDRGKHYDAAVSRVSRHSQTSEAARAHAVALAQEFVTPEHRRWVDAVLDDLATSDSTLSPQESSYLAIVRKELQR